MSVIEGHVEALQRAGDAGRCDEEVGRVQRALADDGRVSDEELARERRARETAGKGAMPYPTQGTSCAIFGIQRALDGAMEARRARGAR